MDAPLLPIRPNLFQEKEIRVAGGRRDLLVAGVEQTVLLACEQDVL